MIKEEKQKALDAALMNIEKAYGKGAVMRLGDSSANMNIETVEDLLRLFPRKYEDRREVCYIMEAPFDKEVLVRGKVISRQMRGSLYNKKTPLRILVQDSSADLEVLFFNGRYLANYFNPGSEYTFYGKITLNNGLRGDLLIQPPVNSETDCN